MEGFCSGGGVKQLAETYAREALQAGSAPPWAAGEITAKSVAQAAMSGEPVACAAVSYTHLGIGGLHQDGIQREKDEAVIGAGFCNGGQDKAFVIHRQHNTGGKFFKIVCIGISVSYTHLTDTMVSPVRRGSVA